MGKKIISFLTLAILISSCGNKMSLVKRHYSKGFYVETGKKSRHLDVAKSESKAHKTEKMQPTVVSFMAEEKKNNVQFSASAVNNIVAKAEEKSSFQGQLKKQVPVREQRNIVFKKEQQNNRKLFSLGENQNKTKSSSADTNTIVLIILCLFPFINLIAMYLKDGKNITMNFWICLILDVLFFLPGIIFALLVVLDIINLA